MQKQTNSAPGPQCAPDFEILPLKFWNVSSEWVSAPTVSLKNLLFEQFKSEVIQSMKCLY